MDASDTGIGAVFSQSSVPDHNSIPMPSFQDISISTQLRCWQQGAVSCQVGIRGLETLAGGSRTTVHTWQTTKTLPMSRQQNILTLNILTLVGHCFLVGLTSLSLTDLAPEMWNLMLSPANTLHWWSHPPLILCCGSFLGDWVLGKRGTADSTRPG